MSAPDFDYGPLRVPRASLWRRFRAWLDAQVICGDSDPRIVSEDEFVARLVRMAELDTEACRCRRAGTGSPERGAPDFGA